MVINPGSFAKRLEERGGGEVNLSDDFFSPERQKLNIPLNNKQAWDSHACRRVFMAPRLMPEYCTSNGYIGSRGLFPTNPA
jgi:hypothetical protein